jgi:hypothetical protein
LPRFARPADHEKPISRFDDPDREYHVRYAATDLRGALIEVLQGFRVNQAAEQALASVPGDGGRPGDLEDLNGGPIEEPALIPLRVLEEKRVVRLFINTPRFFDVWDALQWAELERPRVTRPSTG